MKRNLAILAPILACFVIVIVVFAQEPGKEPAPASKAPVLTAKILEASEATTVVMSEWSSTAGIGHWRDTEEDAPSDERWLQIWVELEAKWETETSDAADVLATIIEVGQLKLVDDSSKVYFPSGMCLGGEKKPWKFTTIGKSGSLLARRKSGMARLDPVLLFAVPAAAKGFQLQVGEGRPLKVVLAKPPAAKQPK
jgi:hypothetical protein